MSPLIQITLFKQEEVVTSPSYAWDNQRRGKDPYVILQWTRRGQGIFQIGKHHTPIPTGHAFIAVIPEATAYYFDRQERTPWTFSWMNLQGPLAHTILMSLRKTHGPAIPLAVGSRAGHQLLLLFQQLENGRLADDQPRSEAIYAFILNWWIQLEEKGGREEVMIQAALRHIHERYSDPINIEHLASMLGWSREHFTRAFMRQTGMSPGAHLRLTRIVRAKRLRLKGMSWASIAKATGFATPAGARRACESNTTKPVA
ncbi:MAG: helix-turn-helix domain-containing protein [Verrucomicrobiales bacterium]